MTHNQNMIFVQSVTFYNRHIQKGVKTMSTLIEFIRRKIVALNKHDVLAFISQVYLYIEHIAIKEKG